MSTPLKAVSTVFSGALILAIQAVIPAPLKHPGEIIYSTSPGVEVHPFRPQAPSPDCLMKGATFSAGDL